MRVLFLTSTLPRFSGDMQAGFVIEQAQAWLGARPKNEICILAPHDAGAARREELDGIRVERFRYFLPERWQQLAYPAILPNIRARPWLAVQIPGFLAAEYFAARGIVRRLGVDCIYAHWVMPQGVVAWRIKRSLGIPYILQNHSSDLAVFAKAGSIGEKLARSVLLEAAHFFCVNARQRDEALALLAPAQREAFAQRCTVLPMGIGPLPTEQFAPGRRHDIATIGRLSSKKGINLLILAAEMLAERGMRPSVGIAGDGEERSPLEALVSKSDVRFVGFLTGREKDHFLASADRFAFPALAADGDVEGMPVALLEALARGAPVLASRDTNVELLAEWQSLRDEVVFIEDPSDIGRLASALADLLQRDRCSDAMIEIMARYRWDRLIEEYLKPIEAVVRAA